VSRLFSKSASIVTIVGYLACCIPQSRVHELIGGARAGKLELFEALVTDLYLQSIRLCQRKKGIR